MAITFFCAKEEIMKASNWDQVINVLYTQGKKIQLKVFMEYYSEVFID